MNKVARLNGVDKASDKLNQSHSEVAPVLSSKPTHLAYHQHLSHLDSSLNRRKSFSFGSNENGGKVGSSSLVNKTGKTGVITGKTGEASAARSNVSSVKSGIGKSVMTTSNIGAKSGVQAKPVNNKLTVNAKKK